MRPSRDDIAIEFAGWIPATRRFGYSGSHPQFDHIDYPPPGYRFVQFGKLEVPWMEHTHPKIGMQLTKHFLQGLPFQRLFHKLGSLFLLAASFWQRGLGQVSFTLASAVRLWRMLRKGGASALPAFKFIESRHLVSQLLLPRHPNLLFVTSVPFTYGQHPWDARQVFGRLDLPSTQCMVVKL